MQIVKRMELTENAVNTFFFNGKGRDFLVKNFSDSDLLVSFDSEAPDDEWIKIPANMYQVCTVNALREANSYRYKDDIYKDKLYLKGSGEVEVQVLVWV